TFLEHARKFAGNDLSFAALSLLSALFMPSQIYTILPLIVVIACIAVFLNLSRTSELVIARAAGRSAARFLIAPTLAIAGIGVFSVAVINPIVANTSTLYEAAVADLNGTSSNALTVSSEGVWLRQGTNTEQVIIHAERVNLAGTEFYDTTFFTSTTTGSLTQRVHANVARLDEEQWLLSGVTRWPLAEWRNAQAEQETFDTMTVPTNLTIDQIRNSFGTPASIPIWDLPGFIATLEQAGFSAKRHTVWWHMELALPLFLIAVALIGAAFTIQPSRLQNKGLMVLFAILCGFGLYFVRNFSQILGENGQLPPALAAWVPPFVGIGLCIALILHQEDG
ncbi:MAG: LPS export ABC transporter permease LptG, partial [Pseudomonadota bacterium]